MGEERIVPEEHANGSADRPLRRAIAWLLLPALLAAAGCVPLEEDYEGKRLARMSANYTYAASHNPTPESPLTLEKAIEYALQHNLSIRAAELEFAIQNETKSSYYLRMLPSLTVRGGFDTRDKYDASYSETLGSGRRGTSASYSDAKSHRTADVSLVWSLLDFGLSYIRAYQSGENVKISLEQLRRLRQQVAMETAVAYYRAAAAAETVRECASLANAINVQLEVIRQESELRNISEMEEARRSLPFLVGLRRIDDMQSEELNTRANLAKAMGVSRPEDLHFAPVPAAPIAFAAIDDIDALVCRALENRPEMIQGDSKVRITEAEAKAALLQLAPNVNLTAAYNHDTNTFLHYDSWMTAGLSMTWNLLSLPSRIKDLDVAKQRVELELQRERITAASIVMQVHLAGLEIAFTEKRLKNATRIEKTHATILKGVEDSIRDGKSHEADLLLERLRYMSEFANLSRNRADYLAARARMTAALGIDPKPTPDAILLAGAESN